MATLISGRMGIRKRIAACICMAAGVVFALSLSGCAVVEDSAQEGADSVAQGIDEVKDAFGDAFDEASRGIEGIGGDIEGMADTLGGALATIQDAEAFFGNALEKGSRVEVYDASGDLIGTVEDAQTIAAIAVQAASARLVSSHPDEGVEYRFEFYQDEAIKFGQDATDVQQVRICTVETYEGSDIVRLSAASLDFPVDLRCSSVFMEGLRSLASR